MLRIPLLQSPSMQQPTVICWYNENGEKEAEQILLSLHPESIDGFPITYVDHADRNMVSNVVLDLNFSARMNERAHKRNRKKHRIQLECSITSKVIANKDKEVQSVRI